MNKTTINTIAAMATGFLLLLVLNIIGEPFARFLSQTFSTTIVPGNPWEGLKWSFTAALATGALLAICTGMYLTFIAALPVTTTPPVTTITRISTPMEITFRIGVMSFFVVLNGLMLINLVRGNRLYDIATGFLLCDGVLTGALVIIGMISIWGHRIGRDIVRWFQAKFAAPAPAAATGTPAADTETAFPLAQALLFGFVILMIVWMLGSFHFSTPVVQNGKGDGTTTEVKKEQEKTTTETPSKSEEVTVPAKPRKSHPYLTDEEQAENADGQEEVSGVVAKIRNGQ